jgi:alcohol dehydrogenase (NADP+)
VAEVAARRGCSAAHVLLRFAVDRGLQPIAKSETPARIRDNLAAALAAPLAPADMAALEGIRTRFRYVAPAWRDWDGETL